MNKELKNEGMKELESERKLNDLIMPIREWLAGNEHRNALVILSEPKATTHLVLATNTTGEEMIPDMGLIIGMEPQLCDTMQLIVDEALGVTPAQPVEPDWWDTIDYTATSGEVEKEQ